MASEVVLDSSALVAMITGEAGAEALVRKCAAYDLCLVGTPTLVETAIVLVARKKLTHADLRSFLRLLSCAVVPLEANHADTAIDAFEKFGRGRHPAGLNLGDCFSYAVAKTRDIPLLFVGDDFSKTDVKAA